MIQHEQKGALDIEVPRPFHLEAICLLGGGHPVPLAGRREAKLITNRVGINIHTWPFKGTKAIPLSSLHVSLCSHAPGPLTSTRWLSGPYSSLSSSMTRLLKNEENFLFCLLGWGWKGRDGSAADLSKLSYAKLQKEDCFSPEVQGPEGSWAPKEVGKVRLEAAPPLDHKGL